jgi:hypothetical protein
MLAVLQFLTPIFTILFNAAALRVSPLRVASWIFARPPLEVFETLALMPIAGLAIYVMRRWSYAIFIVALSWSVFRNLSHWNYSSAMIPAPALLFIYFSEISFVTYFLLPSVRNAYFDPNIRWWEHKPRYLLELAASFTLKSGAARGQGMILNLSEGGAFLKLKEKIQKDQDLRLEFNVLTLPFSVEGRVVHAREVDGGTCYGIQFAHTAESRQSMQRLTAGLDALGFNERDGRQSPFAEFKSWLTTLLKTGKGLVPEVPKKRG